MTARVIDGNQIARKVRGTLVPRIDQLRQHGIIPGLAVVLVGENAASLVYVERKVRACRDIGMRSTVYRLPENVTQAYHIFLFSTQRLMMRINVYKKAQMSFLSFIVLLLLINSVSILRTSAQDEPALIIEIYDSNDWNESTDNIFFEGRTYDIIVASENETVVLGFNVSLLGVTYTTSIEEPFITVLPPISTTLNRL